MCVCVCVCVGLCLGVLGPPTCLLIGHKDLQVFGAGHTHSWGLFQGRGAEQGQQSKEGHQRSLERWVQLLSLSLLGCTDRCPFPSPPPPTRPPPSPRQAWESRSGMPGESLRSALMLLSSVQARSAHCTTGHIERWGGISREDGKLMSQSNHLFRDWMPLSFIEQRAGGEEEGK